MSVCCLVHAHMHPFPCPMHVDSRAWVQQARVSALSFLSMHYHDVLGTELLLWTASACSSGRSAWLIPSFFQPTLFGVCAFMYLLPPTRPSTHPQVTRIQMACAAYKHAWLSRADTSMEAQQVQDGSLSLQDVRWLRAQWLLSRTLNAALYDVSSTRIER